MDPNAYMHIRIDETTGKKNYYFPMELRHKDAIAWAKEQRLDICRTRLGNRVILAAMIPCKDTVKDGSGNEIFIDTPEEKQHQRYLEYIRDELREQERAKWDGRCMIPDGRGGLKRCPYHVPNPTYTPENGQNKLIRVRCEGCKYEPFKQEHTVIELSCMDIEIEFHDDQYESVRQDFLDYVTKQNPQLTELADLLTKHYNKSEISKMISKPRTTLNYKAKLLAALLREYLDD